MDFESNQKRMIMQIYGVATRDGLSFAARKYTSVYKYSVCVYVTFMPLNDEIDWHTLFTPNENDIDMIAYAWVNSSVSTDTLFIAKQKFM